MIEKHIYQCEVCGKEFAFEDECLAHELKHKITELDKDVALANSSGDIIFPIINWEKAIDQAYFVYVANEQAAKKLWDLFNGYHYSSPADDTESNITYPAFFIYNNKDMCWDYFQDIEDKYREYFTIKDNIEANLH